MDKSSAPKGLFNTAMERDREARQQEQINRKVLVEWFRVSGIPMSMIDSKDQSNPQALAKFVEDIFKGKGLSDDDITLSWPSFAGKNVKAKQLAVRGKFGYKFWSWFISDGRLLMAAFNKSKGCDIKIDQDRTVIQTDNENLGMFLRRQIKQEFSRLGKGGTEVKYKKGKVTIGKGNERYSALVAVLIGLPLDQWEGLPVYDLLSKEDKTKLDSGDIIWGQEYKSVFGVEYNPPVAESTQSTQGSVQVAGPSGNDPDASAAVTLAEPGVAKNLKRGTSEVSGAAEGEPAAKH